MRSSQDISGLGRPLRIACVIAGMQAGGAERVMAQLCNHLAQKGHAVTLVTLTPAAEPSFHIVSDAVHRSHLGRHPEGSGLARFARVANWIAALRRTLTQLQPDVVISFVDLTNVMVLLATVGLKIPVIVSERVDPTVHASHLSPFGRLLRRLIYPRASRIVVQTGRAARFFDRFLSEKVIAIPNPVVPTDLTAHPGEPSADGRYRIIGVGRLNRQKGFDILIDSFAELAVKFPNWDVVIFGQGPARSALLEQIKARGLEDRIRLMGISTDIATEIARSHLMAFPSRYEGFPNALAEGMAGGLPVTAFRNVSGVEDLVVSGESGILTDLDQTPDPAKLFAEALVQFMASTELRCQMGEAAKVRTNIFAPRTIFDQWDKLIATVLRHR